MCVHIYWHGVKRQGEAFPTLRTRSIFESISARPILQKNIIIWLLPSMYQYMQ